MKAFAVKSENDSRQWFVVQFSADANDDVDVELETRTYGLCEDGAVIDEDGCQVTSENIYDRLAIDAVKAVDGK